MSKPVVSQEEKEKVLGASLIFQSIDGGTRSELCARAHVVHYTSGDVIFRSGDPGATMLAIIQGSVRISILTPTAREIVLGEMKRGDVIGEIALLDGQARSADATALTNCTAVVLERRAVMAVLERDARLGLRLISVLSGRIRRSDERMMELTFLELPVRLARALLRASAASDPPAARLSLSQSELANMVGTTRESVNRCLRGWQKRGFVDLRDGWLILSDRAAIEGVGGLS